MKFTWREGSAVLALLAAACSGKLAGGGSDGGQSDEQPAGSSGGSGGFGSSSSTGSSGGSGASSSGLGSSSGTGSGSSGGSGGSGSSGGSGGFPYDGGIYDSGINCGSTPTLHVNPPGDIFCGFGADAGLLQCIASQGDGTCCLGGSLGGGMYAPQMCAQNAAGCMIPAEGMNPIPIQCNQIADCAPNGAAGATACCLQGAPALAAVPGCGYYRAKGGSAIVCEGSGGGAPSFCAAGEVQVCSSNADCASGMTCTPGKWKIYQLGFCM